MIRIATDDTLKELKDLTRNRKEWKSNIGNVAAKLNENCSDEVKAKALWLLGEMGLKYPSEIEDYVADIAGYMTDGNAKLRERSANAMGRIGRADTDLIIPYMENLMEMKDDEAGNVRHAFIWACENIASSAPELFCNKLDIFYRMISDSNEKVRIEAPEMFRVVGKGKPECVKPYLDRLEWISQNDEHPVVCIHSAGAVRITKKALKEK